MSVPRGFYELADATTFTPPVPAFVRGLLMDKHVYDKSPMFGIKTTPRTILYGGPLQSIELAREWDQFLFFWASANNKVWLSDGVAPIVPVSWAQWPANSSFQWTWVRELSPPRLVKCSYKGGKRITEWA
jgi:hypothetical protein